MRIKLPSALVLFLALAGCATDGEKKLDYRSSEITPTLEIPPDLTRLNADENLDLPGSDVGRPGNTGRYVETGNLNIEIRTLPRIEGLRIDGQGDLHWLVVPQAAERLYPLIKTFWAEQGFRLTKDEPAVGVMETEWLTLRTGSGSFWTSLLESLSAAEARDQYKARLERAGQDTRVYLAHRGQELVISDNDSRFNFERSQGWELVPADPAKEYEMLSRLMLFLGLQDDQVRVEMQKIGLFASRARIQFDEEDGETYLLVTEGFQQAWNRLVHQLDRLNIEPGEKSRKENEGAISLTPKEFMAKGQQVAETEDTLSQVVQVTLVGSKVTNQTRVDVRDERGLLVQTDTSRAMLQELFKLLK
jgi:outer membrane protein assembly factor BamC